MNTKRTGLVLCFALAAVALNAQDIIIKENGDEIKAKITEISASEIKYKKFGNESGPTYSILKSEVFIIKYENGEKEVMSTETAPAKAAEQSVPITPVEPPVRSIISQVVPPPTPVSEKPGVPDETWKEFHKKRFKRNAFGLDWGTHLLWNKFGDNKVGASMGFRYLHNWNQFIGNEFFKIGVTTAENLIAQFMTGIRCNLPFGYSNKSFYLAPRAGAGIILADKDHKVSFCTEIECGVQLSRTFMLGYYFNYQGAGYIVRDDYSYKPVYAIGFRIGFNFGKAPDFR
ncbi:MAG: hypothetical protein LBT04_07510 [Prevotellaceae bacterium]|jgi:hypothetical protein|nr:hypothetical protein [Prevotellaceae bacterium]